MAHHQPIRKQTTATRGDAVSTTSAEIPDKLYFRIGEVARLCEVPAYVLRFWEGEFPQLKPNKGGTGQRLFRRRDVEMAMRIKRLLYDEGYTIPGARQLLKSEAKQSEPQLTLLSDPSGPADRSKERDPRLRTLREDLLSLLTLLQGPPHGGSFNAAAAYTLRSGARQANSTPAMRRSSLHPVPATEKLFDFPGVVPALDEEQETEDDSL